jgi:hypothetical protein
MPKTLSKGLLSVLENNDVSQHKANKIEKIAMGDDELKKYLPSTRVILNGDLDKFNSVDDLMPRNPDCVIILFRNSPNQGHWVLLSKYDNIVEYFDPYGYDISHPISWINHNQRQQLNEHNFIKPLFDNSSYKCVVNHYAFQNRKDLSIATCGRWCILRGLSVLNKKLRLPDFEKAIKQLKKETGRTYDNIVSDLINYHSSN